MILKAKFSGILLFVVWLVFIFASCATSPQTQTETETHPQTQTGIDENVLEGFFDEALVHIRSERNRPERSRASVYNNPRNEILYHLDRGMIAHYAGSFSESFEHLEMAERLIEEAFTKSISQEVSSFIVNDNTRDYSGEDYEDLYINIFNALNHYQMGNLESAMVEIRRLNEKANYLSDKYERAVKKAMDSNQQMNPSQFSTEASRFSNSALARYMGMLFYRTANNPDSLRIEYEELQRAYSLAPEVYTNPIPVSVSEELSVPSDLVRLNVIAFTGLSPVKEEKRILVPLPLPPPNNSATIALPVLLDRPQLVKRVEVVLDSGDSFDLELLENMGAVARETFKSRYALTVVKSTARAVIKAGAGAAAAQAVQRRGGAIAGLAVGLAGRVVAEVSEQADTRISRYFPNSALVGGINLAPGTYMMTVNFYGDSRLLDSQQRDVTLQRNALNLEQLVCLGATAAGSGGIMVAAASVAASPAAASVFQSPLDEPVTGNLVADELIIVEPVTVVPVAAAIAAAPVALPAFSSAPEAAANANAGYFVDVNGVSTGPFFGAELRRLISQEELTQETLVWKDGMSAWRTAGAVTELLPLFTPVTPPPLPPARRSPPPLPPLPPAEEQFTSEMPLAETPQ